MGLDDVRGASDLRRLLRNRGFARLYATRLASQTADGVFQASLAAAVLFNPERQTDPAAIAGGFAVLLLPYSVVGPFAGVFLDRWRRQRVLVWANAVRAVFVVTVAGLLFGVGGTSPAFFAAALAAISVNRFYLAALSAALPHVVKREELVTANSIATTSGTLVALLGGALGLGIRAAAGTGDGGSAVVALCSAAGYLLASAAAGRLGRDQLGPGALPRTTLRRALVDVAVGLADGARHVAGRAPAAAALLVIGLHRFCYGVSLVATLLLYRNYFSSEGWLLAGVGGLAEASTAAFAGILAAAVLTPAVTTRIGKEQEIVGVLVLAGVADIALGAPYAKAPLLAASFVFGLASQGSKICVDTIVQEVVDDDFRGRVFSFYDTLFNLTFVAAATTAAFALPPSGKSYPVLVGIAVGYLLAAALYALAVHRYGTVPDRLHEAGPRPALAGPGS